MPLMLAILVSSTFISNGSFNKKGVHGAPGTGAEAEAGSSCREPSEHRRANINQKFMLVVSLGRLGKGKKKGRQEEPGEMRCDVRLWFRAVR